MRRDTKLDYLCELGANAIWLCPCYKSPNEDNGYDVSDYFDIMDEFGTMDDIKKLIAEMHRRGTFKMLNKPEDNFFVYERALGEEKYVVICNFGQISNISVPEGELLLSNYGKREGEFKPFETAVYKI